jgi:hypothetical protein
MRERERERERKAERQIADSTKMPLGMVCTRMLIEHKLIIAKQKQRGCDTAN